MNIINRERLAGYYCALSLLLRSVSLNAARSGPWTGVSCGP